MNTSKRKELHALAVALFDGPGDGVPRSREGIIASIAAALERTHEDGAKSTRPDARRAALQESIAIATGLRQDADSRIRDLERELAGLK